MLRVADGNRFRLLGPLDREEILAGIREGRISIRDEACASNGYWFGFHESDELHRQLGVSWTQLRRDAGEDTRVSGVEGQAEEDTDEITDVEGSARRRARQAPKPPTPALVRAVGQSPSGLSSRVPGWFWLVFGLWALSALYGLFGSTK